jgi:hypothetical protein
MQAITSHVYQGLSTHMQITTTTEMYRTRRTGLCTLNGAGFNGGFDGDFNGY